MRVPIAMPRFSVAAPASTAAILTLLSCAARRRAAASSFARLSAAAAAAAEAGPSPCRSCAVVRLPPRRTGVAAVAASLRSVRTRRPKRCNLPRVVSRDRLSIYKLIGDFSTI